jgi:tRNA A-37 threonylcarbamoyl transferase component Bud32
MSNLTFAERKKLETLFDMGGGYVVDFSHRTFGEFVSESVGKDILGDDYRYESSSKANRLRAFWAKEPNPIVGKLIADLVAYAKTEWKNCDEELVKDCEAIAARLLGPQEPAIETKLLWKRQVDQGAHARVWEAEDELGRRVAVKIYEASAEFLGPALGQAKALARVRHPNVVLVYTTCTVEHPTEPRTVTAIVMEFVDGRSLKDLHRGPALMAASCRSIGMQVVAGIQAIHDAGLTHGDLHEGNVLIDGETAKIIDILYLDTLDELSTTSKGARFRRDRARVKDILKALLRHSDLPLENEYIFTNKVGDETCLEDMGRAFEIATHAVDPVCLEQRVDGAFQRVVDAQFVPSASYAAALADETPDDVVFPLIMRVLKEWAARPEHRRYLKLLWERLDSGQREHVIRRASELFDEAPLSYWTRFIAHLAPFGAEGWRLISRSRRLQIESAIVNDISTGRFDIYGSRSQGGELGRWALVIGEYFEERDQLIDVICTALRADWYTQNYVGKYLAPLIPRLADTESREKILLDALEAATRNDAKVLKQNLRHIVTSDGKFNRGAR